MNHVELYIALLGITLILYMLTRTQEKEGGNGEGVALSVEKWEKFRKEWMEENKRIMTILRQIQDKRREEVNRLEQRLVELEKRIQAIEGREEEQPRKETLPEKPGLETPPKAAVKEKPFRPHLSERYRQVYDCHDQGLTPAQIAKKLGMGVGEVQLVLDLRRKGGGA